MTMGMKLNTDALIARSDLSAIADMIPMNAKILDLGCGSGRLLKALKTVRNAKVMGVERNQDKIIECVQRGVPVVQADLNEQLTEFPDHSYDYVILSRTLQTVKRPDKLLNEMMRIGNHGIITCGRSIGSAFSLARNCEYIAQLQYQAMCIGTPCVAAYVGGVPDMAIDGESALFYRNDDPALLTWNVKRVFDDDNLALKLSVNGRKQARITHDAENNAQTLYNIYNEILK